jgi:hypothetical protein
MNRTLQAIAAQRRAYGAMAEQFAAAASMAQIDTLSREMKRAAELQAALGSHRPSADVFGWLQRTVTDHVNFTTWARGQSIAAELEAQISRASRMQRDVQMAHLFREQSQLDSFRKLVANQKALGEIAKTVAQFGSLPWHRLQEEQQFRDANAIVGASLARSLLTLYPDVGDALARSIAEGVVDGGSGVREHLADDRSIADVVVAAVAKAIEQEHRAVDWRFVLALIVSVMLFLVQLSDANDQSADIAEHMASVERRLLEQREVLAALATRSVERQTWARAKPQANSRRLFLLQAGADVIVLERWRRWTHVRAVDRLSTGAKVALGSGWIQNKYLGRP